MMIQAMIYYDTTTIERLVVFADGDAYYFDGANWQFYFAADINDVEDRIDLVQLTDKLYWTDSDETGVRSFDGTTVSTIAGSPIATILEVVTNRLAASGVTLIPDAVYFSDILDPSTWDAVNDIIRIGSGDGEPITGIRAWQESNLLVFKRKGVWLVNCDPTAVNAAAFQISKIHNTVGLVGRRTIHQVGQDVWFLSRNGVMSVQKQIATSQNLVAVPVSQPIQDVIERINWAFAHLASAICYNNYYLLSVPLDNAIEPDHVIVFHYLTGGFAVFSNFAACCFLEQPFLGKTRLLLGCSTGEVREWLEHLADVDVDPMLNFRDGIVSLQLPLQLPFDFPSGRQTESMVITRAATFGDGLATKNGYYAEIELVQREGTVDISAILDGGEPILLRSYNFETAFPKLPFNLPINLPPYGSWVKKKFPLPWSRRFTELQFKVVSNSGDFRLRRISASAQINAYQPGE